jgi:DUF1365 family protein
MLPAINTFTYRVYFLMLPLRAMRSVHPAGAMNAQVKGSLPCNRWGLLSFYDRDHGLGGPNALAWAESVLADAKIDSVDCEIWLQTFPRVLGYVFKPVSIWYVVAPDERLVAAIAEVNNTFGQRHVYVLSGESFGWGQIICADKVFHVSPFCDVSGTYQFKFTRSSNQIAAMIDNGVIKTNWIGTTEAFTSATSRRAFFSAPLLTFSVVWRIHWQAAKLWFKKTPFYKLPPAPQHFISRTVNPPVNPPLLTPPINPPY